MQLDAQSVTMQKFFGVIFLVASVASGFTAWRVWHEMGEHSVNVLLVLILAFLSFFLLVVGVRFLLKLNPAKEMWRNAISDAELDLD